MPFMCCKSFDVRAGHRTASDWSVTARVVIKTHYRFFDRGADVIDHFGDFRLGVLPAAGALRVETMQLVDEHLMASVKPFDRRKIVEALQVALARSLLPERHDPLCQHVDAHFQTGMKRGRRHVAYLRVQSPRDCAPMLFKQQHAGADCSARYRGK